LREVHVIAPIAQEKYADALYLNFEDIRMVAFEAGDFTRLKQEIDRRAIRVLFFDEIQLAPTGKFSSINSSVRGISYLLPAPMHRY